MQTTGTPHVGHIREKYVQNINETTLPVKECPKETLFKPRFEDSKIGIYLI